MGRKKIYEKTSDAVRVYQSKLGRFQVRMPKDERQRYVDAAAAAGLSMNAFIIAAMNEKIERDGLLPASDPAADGQQGSQE